MKRPKSMRPDWDTYFISIANVIATRANCIRRKVAAVVVKDHRIISTGYNGTPRGVRNCCDGGCARCMSDAPPGTRLDDCVCSHAEENAICQAACYGIPLNGAVLYCTISPCLMCARMIISAGISKVIYEKDYQFGKRTKALFAESGVKYRQFRKKRQGGKR